MTTAVALSAGALSTGCLVTFLVTPFTARLAHRYGVLDRPTGVEHKAHLEATPYLGGIAIATGFVLGAVFLGFVPHAGGLTVLAGFPLIIVVALSLALVGLADDVRALPRTVRLGAQLATAVAAWEAGFRVELFPYWELNVLLTIFWIVGVTNAFNLLDNMDGLTAGLAGISALSFAVLGVVAGLFIVPVASAALAGAAFGFLMHNKHPAKIFMGDAGSTFLGFLLALFGLALRFPHNLKQVTFLVPIVTLGVPILDTSLVVVSRLRHHRPVTLGGRDHISHRLVRLGLSVRAAVGLLYFSAFCAGWLGLVVSLSGVVVGWMLLGFTILLAAFFGVLLMKVPVYDNSLRVVRADTFDPDAATASRER